MKRTPRLALTVLVAAVMSACTSMKSHDELSNKVQDARHSGGIPAALQQLDASVSSDADRAELLYNMERGELLRLNKQLDESTKTFLKADAKVQEWEDTAKTNPSKLLGMLGASLISERLKAYEGRDYEKVWLTTRLAMNRLGANDLENARVDIKRTHEREAVIAEFRSKETDAAENEAKSKGANVQGKDINGYPVETLNDPEVLKLKNGYQNALSHYLAGFVYEVTNEPGLAAPGYRKAIELKPDSGVLEEGLRGLDARTSFTQKRKQRMTDTLFVIEAGSAPARKSRSFTLPVWISGKLRTVSISYPVIEPSHEPLLNNLVVNGQSFKLESVVDLNVMARRELKEDMPGMIFRNVTRAIAKGVVQDQLEKKAGLLGAVIGSVASAVTEQADDRIWRTLPGRVYVARGYLPEGEHRLTVAGRDLGAVKVGGQYAMVPVRLYDDSVIQGPVSSFGTLAAAPVADTKPANEAVKPADKAGEKAADKPGKKSKKAKAAEAAKPVNG
ncbi:COG3014 family protein [Chitinimonas sp.]|uniref:COG3014 family protein n=1 Tax=Chitinimonas sp. TaxID=1934313 RepID=UPI0035B4C1AF